MNWLSNPSGIRMGIGSVITSIEAGKARMHTMDWMQRATTALENLLDFAVDQALIEELDRPYFRNLLMDAMGMDAPAEGITGSGDIPETATSILNELCDLAVEKNLIEDMGYARELFSTRLMGVVTPAPASVRASFAESVAAGKPMEATQRFYKMCRACDYIKVDAIAQNVRYFADSPAGELEITINLSKPEKDPKEIAKLKNAPSVGYPRCMLCVENPGYAGRSNFPARQNHRVVPLTLAGQRWFMQYSPYAYYPEHCIVFNERHIPMKIDRGTFERLFSFVEQFPHYMLGSNADLPIVGGSILNHDHFQGGCYHFPMDKAGVRATLATPDSAVSACVLDWPMSTVQLIGSDPALLINEADRILNAWRGWSDPACGIFAETDGTPHNTITPILRKADGVYKLNLVLRNNRTSDEHPLGIFHPHAPLHHIKKENIGLIEVMGLFILPGRLKTELTLLHEYLTGRKPMIRPEASDPSEKHYDWLERIVAEHGLCHSDEEAESLLRSEVAKVCAQVLADAGVYKRDENGLNGIKRFMASVGYQA